MVTIPGPIDRSSDGLGGVRARPRQAATLPALKRWPGGVRRPVATVLGITHRSSDRPRVGVRTLPQPGRAWTRTAEDRRRPPEHPGSGPGRLVHGRLHAHPGRREIPGHDDRHDQLLDPAQRLRRLQPGTRRAVGPHLSEEDDSGAWQADARGECPKDRAHSRWLRPATIRASRNCATIIRVSSCPRRRPR